MTNSNREKNGPVVLVTGAAGIIGPAICKQLSEEGWRVAASDLKQEYLELPEKVGLGPIQAEATFLADLSDGDQACRDLVWQVESTLGPVAALVNNAVLHPPPPELGEVSSEYSRLMMEINLLAPFHLVQAALPSLTEHSGAVVNMSSILAVKPRFDDLWYPVVKAGLEKLTEVLAQRLLPQRIRCNRVRVGSVPGYHFMRETLLELPAEKARKLHEEVMDRILNSESTLLRERRTSPDDIAKAVAFLLSEESCHITGTVLHVDGGMVLDRPTGQRRGVRWQAMVNEWLENNP